MVTMSDKTQPTHRKPQRENLEMIFDILTVINQYPSQLKVTSLITKVNMNYYKIKKILDNLTAKGFIEETIFTQSWKRQRLKQKTNFQPEKSWKITNHGKMLLEKLTQLNTLTSLLINELEQG